jgi:hypothetical protein
MTGEFTREALYLYRGGYRTALELFDVQFVLVDPVAQIEKSIAGIDFLVLYFALIIWANVRGVPLRLEPNLREGGVS